MRRPFRTGLLVFALLLVLVALERGGRELVARTLVPTHDAEWIWAPGPRQQTYPRAFYAVRDFHLDEVPEQAEVLISADEEYVLFLNGSRVGSDRAASPTAVDRYRVASLLRQGGNRLAALVRSSSGAGGLLLSLETSPGGFRLVSDGSWRIFERHHPGLLRGWMPWRGRGLPAVSLGQPPVGRWRVLALGADLPSYEELAGGLLERAPLEPVRVQVGEQGPWSPLAVEAGSGPLGTWVTLDWGREVTGYLVLRHRVELLTATGLLYVGVEPPDPRQGRPVDSCLVTLAESAAWEDALPRRFRYVTVLGLEGLLGAAVYPVDPQAARPLLPSEAPPSRVFGIEGPPLRSPVEDDVWRRLRRRP